MCRNKNLLDRIWSIEFLMEDQNRSITNIANNYINSFPKYIASHDHGHAKVEKIPAMHTTSEYLSVLLIDHSAHLYIHIYIYISRSFYTYWEIWCLRIAI
jgi:hypothetical protein